MNKPMFHFTCDVDGFRVAEKDFQETVGLLSLDSVIPASQKWKTKTQATS